MKKRAKTKAKPQARRRRLDRFVRQDADFLAEQIDAVATLMWALAERMEYFAGFNGEMVKHSREMAGASVIARKWATAIRKPSPSLAAKAADLFETTSALIGKVTEVENGWEVAFAPDCTTWITVRRDEHDEPKVGDSITVTVPKVVAIHSQPNASLDRPAASAGTVGGVVGLLPVGLIPIPPMILQEANRRAMENGDLTFGHGCALGLALCATWGLCAVAIWIKRAIVRRFHKANVKGDCR